MRYKIYLSNSEDIPVKEHCFLRFDTMKNSGYYINIGDNFVDYCNATIGWSIEYAYSSDFDNFVFSYNTKEEAIEEYNKFKENNPELFI